MNERVDFMEQSSDDIDILLKPNPSGWSMCFIVLSQRTFEFTISNIFGEPYIDLIKGLSDLINGENNMSFIWYSEPGGEKIEINRILTQENRVLFTAYEFSDSFGREI